LHDWKKRHYYPSVTMKADRQFMQEMSDIEWYHRIPINGVTTPGKNLTHLKLKTLHLPESFEGLSVLDVGAWDGFFSFEAERRGASRVVALDSFIWRERGRKGFDFAKKALGSKVEPIEMEVLDICPERLGSFDVVLFLGVLYHMKHPLLALEKVASVTKKLLIVETLLDAERMKRPAMIYYPGDQQHKDSTNWWGPNTNAVVDMLTTVGFPEVEVVSKMPFRTRLAKGFYDCWKGRTGYSSMVYEVFNQGRGTFHARAAVE